MMTRKKQRKRKGGLISRMALFCFVVYVTVALVNMQLEVTAKRRELHTLQDSIVQQELLNDETRRILMLEEDERYVERIARDKLGFAYPNERIYIDRSGQ